MRINCRTAAVALAAILLTMFGGCSGGETAAQPDESRIIPPNTTTADTQDGEYAVVEENDAYRLRVNTAHAAIRVEDKKSGAVWDTLAQGETPGTENSLVQIQYLDATGLTASMSLYNDCIARGQYKLENTEDGIVIRCTLGEVDEKQLFPPAFTVERYEKYSSKIKSRYDKTIFKTSYWLVDIEAVTDGNQKKQLLSQYPALSAQPLYVLKDTEMPSATKRDLNRILKAAGYTEQDYADDVKGFDVALSSKNPTFSLNLYISLNKSGMRLRIPVKEILEYNGARLTDIDVMPTWGSPARTDSGYFLLPDGSGSLLRFPSRKTGSYSVPVYGRDLSIPLDENIYANGQAAFPIWGIVYPEQKSMLAVIEDGEAFASIEADAGSEEFLAGANARFRVREQSRSKLKSASSAETDFFVTVQSTRYPGDIAVQYHLLDSGYADYSKLAEYYGRLLFPDKTEMTEALPPVVVELVGTADMQTAVLGFQTKKNVTYTTLGQALDIGRDILAAGVRNLTLKMSGFFNGGLDHGFLNKLSLNPSTGTQTDLDALMRWGEENGVDIFFDFDVQYVTEDRLFDGFSQNDSGTIALDYMRAFKAAYHPGNFTALPEKNRFILNPPAVVGRLDTLAAGASAFGLRGLSLRYMGSEVNADYNAKQPVDRQSAVRRFAEALAKQDLPLLLSGMNAWALPYAAQLLQAPPTSAGLDVTDDSVPFAHMALNPYIQSAGRPVNLYGNTKEEFLSAVMNGSGLYYVLTADGDATFSDSTNEELYSTDYSLWKEDLVNKALELQSPAMQGSGKMTHMKLEDGVYRVQYENGFTIHVNFGDTACEAQGNSIPPKSYITGKGPKT